MNFCPFYLTLANVQKHSEVNVNSYSKTILTDLDKSRKIEVFDTKVFHDILENFCNGSLTPILSVVTPSIRTIL